MAYCTVEGVRLYYEWTPGDPERTVVFLNGVMTTTSSWELYRGLWADQGWGVLLHDFRGQLQSDRPPGPYTFRRHVEDLAALLEHLGIAEAHLIGTSCGGEVALHAAVERPAGVRSLTVIDSVSELDALIEAFVRSWILLARKETAREFYWAAIPILYSSGFIRGNRKMLEERVEVFAARPEQYFAGQRTLYETFLSLDLTARLRARGDLRAARSPEEAASRLHGPAQRLRPPGARFWRHVEAARRGTEGVRRPLRSCRARAIAADRFLFS